MTICWLWKRKSVLLRVVIKCVGCSSSVSCLGSMRRGRGMGREAYLFSIAKMRRHSFSGEGVNVWWVLLLQFHYDITISLSVTIPLLCLPIEGDCLYYALVLTDLEDQVRDRGKYRFPKLCELFRRRCSLPPFHAIQCHTIPVEGCDGWGFCATRRRRRKEPSQGVTIRDTIHVHWGRQMNGMAGSGGTGNTHPGMRN